jgi:hypothetical protein
MLYAAGTKYEYWALKFTTEFDDLDIRCLGVDGDFVYIGGNHLDDWGILKATAGGLPIWFKVHSPTTYQQYPFDIAFDSDGDIQIVGEYDNSASIDPYGALMQIDTDGAKQSLNLILGATSTDEACLSAVDCDSSGYTYVGGSIRESGVKYYIGKYNNAGTVQWERKLTGVGSEVSSLSLDGSSNVHGSATYSNTGAIIFKYNSSGTIQWHRTLTHATHTATGFGRAVRSDIDSSGNMFVAVAMGTTDRVVLAKYNSSGTIQWQRELLTTAACYVKGCKCDSSGNVYVHFGISGLTDETMNLAKWNSSGTIQWQRDVETSAKDHNNANIGTSLAIDSNDDLYFGFNYNNSGAPIVMKVPNDGTGTGTWLGDLVYASTSYTEQDYDIDSTSLDEIT